MSERQKVLVALLISALLHLLALFVLGVTGQFVSKADTTKPPPPKPLEVTLLTRAPEPKKIEPKPAKPEIKPVPERLNAVATPKPTPVLAATTTPKPEPPKPKATPKILRELNDSEGLAETKTAPKNAVFYSDKNSVAGSEMPATGDAPLPGQAGKERPFTFFEDKNYSPGKLEDPPGRAGRPELARSELPKPEPIRPPTTVVQPTPAPIAPVPTPPPAVLPPEPMFKPEPLPVATPTPVPDPDAMRLVKAAPTPQPTPFDLPKPKPLDKPSVLSTPVPTPQPTPQQLAMLAKPPVKSAMPNGNNAFGFQAEKEKVKIEGGISNRGKKGVDAVETPLGRYRAAIAKAISQRWNEYVREHMDLITLGTVKVRFYISSRGRVEDIRVLSNSSSEAFATYTIKSIMDANIPPIPPDVVPLLDSGRLEITEWSFTIYPE